MTTHRSHAVTVVLLGLLSWPAYAINQCTDSNGNVSFQDAPCPPGSVVATVPAEKETHKQKSEFQLVSISLRNGRHYGLHIPHNWQYEINDFKDSPALRESAGVPDDWQFDKQAFDGMKTLKVTVAGDDPLIMLLTFTPNRTSLGLDRAVLNDLMQGIREQHNAFPTERFITSQEIKLRSGNGIGQISLFKDEALAAQPKLPPDEYIFVTAGAMVIDGHVITLTVLCNDVSKDNYLMAITSLHFLLS